MEFVKRISAPSASNEYYKHTSCNGLNSCILIENCSVLPNCVGYAWGRAYEIMESKPKLSRGNAEDWYGYSDGYERGNSPKLGAIVCWKKGATGTGADGAGHVAVVEEIYSDGSILTSNSAYGSTRFYTKKLSNTYYMGSSYDFQGFIYLPVELENSTDEESNRETKSIDEVAQEVINGLWGNNPERKEKLEAAGYNYDEVQSKVNSILSGNNDKETSVTYTVKSGDTLSAIAKKYDTTWKKIYEDNKSTIGNNPNLIKVGQKLTINV